MGNGHSLCHSTPPHVTSKVVQNTRPSSRFLGVGSGHETTHARRRKVVWARDYIVQCMDNHTVGPVSLVSTGPLFPKPVACLALPIYISAIAQWTPTQGPQTP